MDFYGYLESCLDSLVHSYEDILKINNGTRASSSTGPDYTFAVRYLNTSIGRFKEDMRSMVSDYAALRDSKKGKVSAHSFIVHLETILDKFKEVRSRVVKTVPPRILKSGLGKNFEFHEYSGNLSAEALYQHFETNYHINS